MIKDSERTEFDNNLIVTNLKLMRSLSLVIRRITNVLSVIANKRMTLAEKAIQEELLLCAERESFLLCYLSKSIREKSYCLSEDDCSELRRINIKLNKQLQAFIKAASYNLNYLEQYFEHDFWLELTKTKFAANLYRFIDGIETKRH